MTDANDPVFKDAYVMSDEDYQAIKDYYYSTGEFREYHVLRLFSTLNTLLAAHQSRATP